MKILLKCLLLMFYLVSFNSWALEPLENYNIYSSSDGSRSVKISKNSGEAYFYDNTKKNSTPIDLGSVAESVEFKDGNGTLEIILKFNTGETQTFNSNGTALTDRDSEIAGKLNTLTNEEETKQPELLIGDYVLLLCEEIILNVKIVDVPRRQI